MEMVTARPGFRLGVLGTPPTVPMTYPVGKGIAVTRRIWSAGSVRPTLPCVVKLTQFALSAYKNDNYV